VDAGVKEAICIRHRPFEGDWGASGREQSLQLDAGGDVVVVADRDE
jgi:hypothetical protein